jgi:hypothetical protein
MVKRVIIILAVFTILAAAGYYYFAPAANGPEEAAIAENIMEDNTGMEDGADTSGWKTYRNEEYGFELLLSDGWEGYSITEDSIDRGLLIMVRHPAWTEANKHADIPVLVYTLGQWKEWESENFESYQTAAPIGPMERGRNTNYVFATAPRYNYSFLEGWEDVEEIIKMLRTFKPE